MNSSEMTLVSVQNLIQQGQYRKALGQLSLISNQFSHDETYLKLLAETQKQLSDQMGLLKTYETLYSINDEAYYQAQVIKQMYRLNMKNQALDHAYNFLNKLSERLLKIDVLLIIVKIYIEENDFEGIQEVLQELKLLQFEDEFTLWAEGLYYLSQKNNDQAIKYFRQSAFINDQKDYVWVSLSMLHYEMGDFDLAIANIEKALDLNPQNAVAVKMYAQWSMKNPNKSNKVLQKVQFYLSNQAFDEDISLCHVQLLCQRQDWSMAGLELDKLFWKYPENESYLRLKNSLQDLQQSC